MYDQLKKRITELLAAPRPLKAQTERQILHHLQEHGSEMSSFFSQAAKLLQDHELDILFAPLFTPTLEDQAAVSEILAGWKPSQEDLDRLLSELCAANGHALVQLPDGTETQLPLHEVMIERFVRLLHLDQAPAPELAEILQDALPSDLYAVAAALMRQRGITAERQAWLTVFIRHMARRYPVNTAVLTAAAEFIATQPSLDHAALLSAAQNLVKAAKSAAEYAQAGRMYWSPDVAQHHQYRGEGRVNQVLVKQRLEELTSMETIAAALQMFEGHKT